MKYNLKSMTRKELEKLKTDVDKALSKVATKEKKAALAAAEKAAAAMGYSLAEITGGEAPKKTRKAKAAPKKAGAPKYRNPADPDQTWTGKGRQPSWFKDAIMAGKTPESLEI